MMDLTLTRLEQLALRGIQDRQAALNADLSAFQEALAERLGIPSSMLGERFQLDGTRLVPVFPAPGEPDPTQMDTWGRNGQAETAQQRGSA